MAIQFDKAEVGAATKKKPAAKKKVEVLPPKPLGIPEVVDGLPVVSARLPFKYESARKAIASAAKIDECKEWADKAQALASYARQANDDRLLKQALRIQSRAISRAGELLKVFDARGAHRRSIGGDTSSQRQAAEEAGMSKRQQTTAVRAANVPEEEREAQIESDNPPTPTQLAEQGKKARELPPRPEGWQEATKLMGGVRTLAEFCSEHFPDTVWGGVLPHERDILRTNVKAVQAWLTRLEKLMENQNGGEDEHRERGGSEQDRGAGQATPGDQA